MSEIEEMVDERSSSLETKSEAFGKLSQSQKDRIEKKAAQMDVSAVFDNETVIVKGYYKDLGEIVNEIHEVAMAKYELFEYVGVTDSQRKITFDVDESIQIEKALKMDQEEVLEIKHQDDNGKVNIYHLDLKGMKITQTGNENKLTLERVTKLNGKFSTKFDTVHKNYSTHCTPGIDSENENGSYF